MFSEMIAGLNRSILPEPVSLAKRFDFALTKKHGVVKLPPAFWMQDTKINPRSDHLLWAALLLLDRTRIEMALSVLAMEVAEISHTTGADYGDMLAQKVSGATEQLLEQLADPSQRDTFVKDLQKVMPNWPAEILENMR